MLSKVSVYMESTVPYVVPEVLYRFKTNKRFRAPYQMDLRPNRIPLYNIKLTPYGDEFGVLRHCLQTLSSLCSVQ
jgi:hypothetical protein